jgi:hypothetical protein
VQVCAAPLPAPLSRTQGQRGDAAPFGAGSGDSATAAELQATDPGPVEVAVQQEINGLAAETRPGLVAVARDVPHLRQLEGGVGSAGCCKSAGQRAGTLRKSAQGRRGNLAVVRAMASSRPPDSPRRKVVPRPRPAMVRLERTETWEMLRRIALERGGCCPVRETSHLGTR